MNSIQFNSTFVEFPDLLIIAGEQSGDEHAAKIVQQLKAKKPGCNICAIGGENLEKSGVNFLFNLVDYSVVGITEVLKNIQTFSKLLRNTCDWIEQYHPKAVCFVDFPGFNLHVAKELFRRRLSHKGGGNILLHHYISPQIWAWKAKRRFAIAKYIDFLGTIFPFEKKCYNDTDLNVQFLGHPFLEEDYQLPVQYDPQGPILLLPGSRKTAVKRIFPVLLDSIKQFQKNDTPRALVCIYPSDEILEDLQSICKKYKNLTISFVKAGTTPVSASVAISSSGTMALNCALAGIPSIIVYKASTVTYGIAKLLVKVKFLHMANILLGRESAPEFLQFSAKPKLICGALKNALYNPEVITKAQKDAELLKAMLRSNDNINVVSWLESSIG